MNPPVRTREFMAVAVTALAITGLYFLLTWAGGALDIARNDDWSFIENAFRFSETGVFAVGGWVQMTLIGQLLAAAPLLAIAGPSVVTLQLLTGAFGVVLLISSYALVRNFLSPAWASLATATLALGPLYGLLAPSFMTDIPAAACQVLALALAARGLRGNQAHWVWLAAAGTAGVVGFSIREYAAAALVAIGVVLFLGRRHSVVSKSIVAWWMGLVASALIAIVIWRSTQVTFTDSQLGLNSFALAYLARTPITVAFFAIPAIMAINPIALFRSAWKQSRGTFLVTLSIVLALTAHARWEFIGNYWGRQGGYPWVIRGDAPDVLPSWLWTVILVAATLSLVMLAALLSLALGTLRDRKTFWTSQGGLTLAAVFVSVSLLAYAILPTVAIIPLFDRYFIGVIGIVAGLLLWLGKRYGLIWKAPAFIIGVLSVFAVVSASVVAATAAIDGARWQLAAEVAELLDVPRGNIDGGFDWYGFHTDGAPRPMSSAVRWTWWTAELGERAICATLFYEDPPLDPQAAGPAPDAPPVMSRTLRTWFSAERSIVALLGPDDCDQS